MNLPALPRAVRLVLALAALTVLALLSPRPARAADQDPPPLPVPQVPRPVPTALPTISLQEIKAGQQGYGLSVFSGARPERFDVEVVGVMRNVSPDTNYILARLTGKGLEKSGVIAGMSGSPVFIDGRLAGAVAFSWPFSHEAIAGITPIETMHRLAGMGGVEPAAPLPPVDLATLATGKIPADLMAKQLAALSPKVAGGATPSLQWSTTGFGEQSLGLLRQGLAFVAPAGRAAPSGDASQLVPGGSVAAVLVDGDFGLAATGTITDRIGDSIFAFGHPFLALGPTRVPMATSEVVTVLSSQYSSFKIANIGDVVGAFEQDRQAGIQGRLGEVAPMVPMVLRVAGPKPRVFHMRLAQVQQIMPILVGSSTLAGLESASYTAGPQGLDLVARFATAGHGELTFHQSFDGDSAGTECATYLMAIAAYLAQNPLERVGMKAIEVDLAQSPQPRSASLVGANADHTVVRPGQKVTLNLDLVPYRGEPFRHTLALKLPEDLPDGRYSLLVGDGASADGARLAIAPAGPVNIEQALDLLRSLHSRREVAVLGVYGGPGLAVAGEVMPRLPGSVRSLWAAAASGSATPLRQAIAQEYREAMPVPIEGLVRIDLEVRHRDTPAGAGKAQAGTDGEPGDGDDGQAVPESAATANGANGGSR
jgi:SpoIVB peptidase S55